MSPVDKLIHRILDFCSGTKSDKKTVIPQKKVSTARNLKDCLPSLPLKNKEVKKKNKVFLCLLLLVPQVSSTVSLCVFIFAGSSGN
jgi:hypothetical protein